MGGLSVKVCPSSYDVHYWRPSVDKMMLNVSYSSTSQFPLHWESRIHKFIMVHFIERVLRRAGMAEPSCLLSWCFLTSYWFFVNFTSCPWISLISLSFGIYITSPLPDFLFITMYEIIIILILYTCYVGHSTRVRRSKGEWDILLSAFPGVSREWGINKYQPDESFLIQIYIEMWITA